MSPGKAQAGETRETLTRGRDLRPETGQTPFGWFMLLNKGLNMKVRPGFLSTGPLTPALTH